MRICGDIVRCFFLERPSWTISEYWMRENRNDAGRVDYKGIEVFFNEYYVHELALKHSGIPTMIYSSVTLMQPTHLSNPSTPVTIKRKTATQIFKTYLN